MWKYRLLSTIRWAVLGATVAGAWGQVPSTLDPGAVHQQSSDTDQYYDLLNRIQQNRNARKPDKVETQLPRSGITQVPTAQQFLLRRVETTPESAILSPVDIAAITNKYQGRQVSINDLESMVAEFNAAYSARGYITARAVLPPQKVVSGVVRVQFVEARLGKVIVKNNQATKPAYFVDRIGYESGDLIQLDEVNRALVRLNATNDEKVKALLRPGETFGTTDLVLEVQPVPRFNFALTGDDAGLVATGRQRAGASETVSSLFGYRDPLSIGVDWSDGMWSGFLSYNFPITDGDLRLGPEVSYNTIRVRPSAVQKLPLSGGFYDIGLRLSRPLFAGERFLWNGYITPHFQESTLESKGFPISDIPVRAMELGTSLQLSDTRGFFVINASTTGGDYNAGRLDAFVKFDGSASRFQNLGKGFVAILRGQGQAKAADPEPLPPSQQFQIGGLSTVRGYPEGSFIGDTGYALSAEIDSPLPFGGKKLFGIPWGRRLEAAAFIDHAGLLDPHTIYLTGTGGGLIVKLSRYFQGRVYLGTPLEHRSQYHPTQVHFAIEATPPIRKIYRFARSAD
jgi:hemolysin activation/secretion protein